MLYWFPDSKKALFISINMDSETADYEKLNAILLKHLKLVGSNSVKAGYSPKNHAKWKGYYLPVLPKVASLAYFDMLSGFTKTKTTVDGISLKPFQKKETILHPVSDSIFITDMKTRPSHAFYTEPNGKIFMTDGYSTRKKTSGYLLLAHWPSFLLGCLGLLYLLLNGLVRTVAQRKKYFKDPTFTSFVAILLLLIPIPLFLTQPFVAIGDKTPASILLFIFTCFLPLGLLYSLRKHFTEGFATVKGKIESIAIVFSLQWILVLIFWGLIPFRIWM